jgi:hypothetical protein
LYTKSRFLIQARTNWIWTNQRANAYVTTLGVGYQLEKQASVGPATETSIPANSSTSHEITLLAGTSVLNALTDKYATTESVEYRHSLARYLDWTIGWLNEGYTVSRTGPVTQLWVVRPFFNDHVALGLGAGPYLAFDRHGERNFTKVNWIAGVTTSLRFGHHWSLRATWDRVATDYDRDTDVILVGIGCRF